MTLDHAPARVGAPVGVVDGIFGVGGAHIAVAPLDATITVRGWAIDAGATAFAQIECAIGEARATRQVIEVRPDVAAATGSSAEVGFVAEIALAPAGIGRRHVVLRGMRDDGTRVKISVNAALDIVPALYALPDLPMGAALGSLDEFGVEAEALRQASLNGVAAIPLRGVLFLRGWGATAAGEPLDDAYAEIDGDRIFRGMSGYPRADVGASLGTDGLGYGFRIRIPAPLLGVGKHAVRVLVEAGGVLAPIGDPAEIYVAPEADVLTTRSAAHGRVELVGRVAADRRVLDQRSGLRLRGDERLVVTGWAGDPARATLPDFVLLTIDDTVHGAVQRGLRREDVVASTGSHMMEFSGFSTVISADRLSPGQHQAELIALYGDEVVLFDAFSFEVGS